MGEKMLVVLSFVVDKPEDASTIIKAVDPPHLPFSDGLSRVVLDPHASELLEWLDMDQ